MKTWRVEAKAYRLQIRTLAREMGARTPKTIRVSCLGYRVSTGVYLGMVQYVKENPFDDVDGEMGFEVLQTKLVPDIHRRISARVYINCLNNPSPKRCS